MHCGISTAGKNARRNRAVIIAVLVFVLAGCVLAGPACAGASDAEKSQSPRSDQRRASVSARSADHGFHTPVVTTAYRAGGGQAPEFPLGLDWLNTAGPLRLHELRGKFVLLDFWTYCCINCMHILPELKKLERAYPDQLVVIGVHSAKFATERESDNIREAILRYEIEHPVVNDLHMAIWSLYSVTSWPRST
jgi:thiol-disulfide isomerase/thioredoxin